MSATPPDRFRLLNLVGLLVVAGTTALLPLFFAREVEVDRAAIAEADALYAEALAIADAQPAAARERFLAAATAFAAADPSRRSAGSVFNEANARLQAGELGAAIAGYRTALELDPHDPRILANLGEARSKVIGSVGVPDPTPLERAGRLWSLAGEQTRWTFAIALLWTSLLLAVFARNARPAALAALALAVIVGATVIVDVARRTNSRVAVLVGATLMRKGNGEGFEPMLAQPLPPGTECLLLERRPGWAEIEIAGGTRGWVREDTMLAAR